MSQQSLSPRLSRLAWAQKWAMGKCEGAAREGCCNVCGMFNWFIKLRWFCSGIPVNLCLTETLRREFWVMEWVLPESQPLERESVRTPLVWHVSGWITSIKLGQEYTWRLWKQEISGRGRDECQDQLDWGWIQRERKKIYERLWLCSSIFRSSPLMLENEHQNFCAVLVLLHSRVSQVRCSHSYVTIVVWLWHFAVTKGILAFILPMNPNSHTAKIWSGLSKCRNISGIPEVMLSGPQFNQEKAAELAQICHHKSVFLAQTLRSTHSSLMHYALADEGITLPVPCELG